MKKIFCLLVAIPLFVACTKEKLAGEVVSLQKGEVIQSVKFLGKMLSASKKVIIAPFDGQVEFLKVQNGTKVTKNQSLIVLKSKELTNKLDRETRELKNLELQKSSLIAQLRKAEVDLKRAKTAFKHRVISSSEAEDWQVQTVIANNKLKSVQVNIDESQRTIGLLTEQLLKSEIKSPVDGVISESWISFSEFTPGTSVRSGDILFSVIESGDMKIKALVPDYFASQLVESQTVSIQTNSINKKSWQGQIISILSSSKNEGQFEVFVRFRPDNGSVRIGSELITSATIAQKTDALYLPKSAVVKIAEEFLVSKITAAGAVRHPVMAGIIGDDRVEILSGLTEEEKVQLVFR